MEIVAIQLFAISVLLVGHFGIVVWNRARQSR
jgi:hypothetical protein